MKAILEYALYKRPQATNEVEASGYLPAGAAIEVKQVITDKSLDGISIWFFADDGFYYWAGGATFSDGEVFGDWYDLTEQMQKTLLESIVADEAYWFEKKAIGYTGCGWGYKDADTSGGLAISIFVKEGFATGTFCKTIRYKGFEIPVQIKQVPSFHHHQYMVYNTPPISPDILNPVQMGGSISVRNQEGYGTRSMVLKNKQGIICLITCFHVLLDRFKNEGKFPLSPFTEVIAESPSKARNPFRIAIADNLAVLEGRYTADYDFAATVLPEGIRYQNAFNNIDFKDFYLLEELKDLPGQTVTMAGAFSVLQSGRVTDIRASLPVNDSHVCNNAIVTEMISKGGDSGAPVIDKNGKLVGIVVAGDEATTTLILPVTFLFTQLGYQLL